MTVNPVTRLTAALVLTFPLVVTLDWVSAAVAAVLELALYLALNTPRRLAALLKHLIPLLIVAPLAGATLVLYGQPGGQVYWHWGFVTVSSQSLAFGIAITVRVIALGLAVLVTLSDVDPTDMADGLTQVGRLPARFVFGTLAALRLVGALQRDWRALALARRARGLGDTQALKRYATMAFALLVSAIRRGTALATALEARGFTGGPRTCARKSNVTWRDGAYLAGAALIIVAALGTSLVSGQFRWVGGL